MTLEQVVAFAGWPTPDTQNRSRSPDTLEKVRLYRKSDGHNTVVLYLEDTSRLTGWATPSERDYRTPNLESFASRGGEKKGEQLNNQVIHQGPALIGSSAETAVGARLNPAHARWLMRLPRVWDDCAVMAMLSTRKQRAPS